MYDLISGILSMSIFYSPILFFAVLICFLLLQSWLRYVIDDKKYKMSVIKKYDDFFNWVDEITDNHFIFGLIAISSVFYFIFLFFCSLEILSENNKVLLLFPYNYSNYIVNPIIIVFLFVSFTKLCRWNYIKYQDICNKIDKISQKV